MNFNITLLCYKVVYLCSRSVGGKPVIDPYEIFSRRGKSLPSNRVLLFFTKYLFKTARKPLENCEEVKYSGLIARSVKGRYSEKELLLALPYFGAPAAVAALEALIAGGEVFIVVGEAGAVSPALRIGDVLVPTWGLREEGISYHYAPSDYVPRPDPQLANVLFTEVNKLKGRRRIKVLKGGIWTIDAIFRETKDKIDEYSRMGILGVDMESTALMTVASYRKAKLAIVASISDELYGAEWRVGFKTRKLRKTERIIVEAALKTAAQYDQ